MSDHWRYEIANKGRLFLLAVMAGRAQYCGVKWQTAKKVHICDECGRRIEPKMRYMRLVIFKSLSIAQGIQYSGKLCPHCEMEFYTHAPRRIRQ